MKTAALQSKSTFGDPLQEVGVEPVGFSYFGVEGFP